MNGIDMKIFFVRDLSIIYTLFMYFQRSCRSCWNSREIPTSYGGASIRKKVCSQGRFRISRNFHEMFTLGLLTILLIILHCNVFSSMRPWYLYNSTVSICFILFVLNTWKFPSFVIWVTLLLQIWTYYRHHCAFNTNETS